MQRLTVCTIALATTLVTAVVVAQRTAPASELDATMKRIGPAAGAAIQAMLSRAYADAQTQLSPVRTGLVEAEEFFSDARRDDGVNFAKDALAKLDALEQALASAEKMVPTPPEGESPVDAPMKKVGPGTTEVGNNIRDRNYADAQLQLSMVRTGLMEAESFFAERETEEGVKFAKEALAKVEELDMLLAAETVDRGAAQVALRELQGTCFDCHDVFRARGRGGENSGRDGGGGDGGGGDLGGGDGGGGDLGGGDGGRGGGGQAPFVLRPGSAPTPELATAQAALRELQGACTACHTTYRVSAETGEWVLQLGN